MRLRGAIKGKKMAIVLTMEKEKKIRYTAEEHLLERERERLKEQSKAGMISWRN